MIAMEFILNRFVGITTDTIHVAVDFLPIAVVAMLYGPIWSTAAYAIGDVLGALLFPYGPINPGITLANALIGLAYGLIFYKKDLSGKKIILNTLFASLIAAIPIKLFLTTFFLSIAYGTPYNAFIIARIPTCALLFAAQMILIPIVYRFVVYRLPIYRTQLE